MLIEKTRSLIHPAYTEFAEVYDSYTSNRDYASWANYLQSVWGEYNESPKKVLEIACGTGSLTKELRCLGYNVDGLDMSKEMLEKAVAKVPEAKFYHEDMRLMEVDDRFDSVVCLFDGMNYLLHEEEIEQVFKNVRFHLHDDGLFIFDLLSINALKNKFQNRKVIRNSPYKVVSESTSYTRDVVVDFLLKFSFSNGNKRFNELHRFRGYDIGTISSLLEVNDFEVIAKFGGYTLNPPKSNSERIVFVARKN